MNPYNEEELKQVVDELEDKTIEKVCQIIQNYNGELKTILAYITASLCDVKAEDLLVDTTRMDVVRARWLYWYAYHYMTGETHESISRKSEEQRKFATSAVGAGITKISALIDTSSVWSKRWAYLKRVVKILTKQTETKQKQQTIQIKVTAPKGTKIILKQEEL